MRRLTSYVLASFFSVFVGKSFAVTHSLSLSFSRTEVPGPDPFTVTATLLRDGVPLKGQKLSISVPKGKRGSVIDLGNGSYAFKVTPATTGIYPVTVKFAETSIRRDALVLKNVLAGAGQPLLVPGLVNTEGYEDGVTITPDGQYLFVQYGPIYFSGLFLHKAICAEEGWSMYSLNNCLTKPDASWVFQTIGPYNTAARPRFPVGAIKEGKLTHIPGLVIDGLVNGLVVFPTVLYGFKRQSDGTFRQPFKVAFNDYRGTNGPFGISFQMTGATTARFVLAWQNYFNDPGNDDKPDVWEGTLVMGKDKNLGEVTYEGEMYKTITPYINLVNLPSHAGVQGNPHLYYNSAGVIESIWTDDEQVSHDLTVHKLTSGTFPKGLWKSIKLPHKINTSGSESMPFFTGKRLYFSRNMKIVYHEYRGGDYTLDSSWGDEVVVLESGEAGAGTIFGLGEPTLATVDGKTYLYFASVETRASGQGMGRFDFDLDAAFVELP